MSHTYSYTKKLSVVYWGSPTPKEPVPGEVPTQTQMKAVPEPKSLLKLLPQPEVWPRKGPFRTGSGARRLLTAAPRHAVHASSRCWSLARSQTLPPCPSVK